MKHPRISLAGINFALADVQGGLGPYLAIYLLSVASWHPGKIGLVLTVSGIATILLQTPAGALVDSTRYKRLIIIIATLIVIVSTLMVKFNTNFINVAISQMMMGGAAAFFTPTIAGITLGIVGHKYFSRQFGENQSFNHAGNVFAAAMTGILALSISIGMMFDTLVAMSVISILFTLSLNKNQIDHNQARGLLPQQTEQAPSGLRMILENKLILIFGASILLFHLANAAMLVLIGEIMSKAHRGGTSVMLVSGSIISAQFIMMFMALLVREKADKWGRKPIFLIAFAVLPIRGLLFMLSGNDIYLLGVQLLDGVGAGIYGALFPVVVSDLTEGSGRYNITLGALSTLQGIGAAFSNLIAGYFVEWTSYRITFLVLALIAFCAFWVFYLNIPETNPNR